ncbi:pentatricopeptide repeat-containing protein At5g47360 isoform X2 [Syzygium oleosum]|uniref:pentatricopeptide repeat-containing protein At5g47360 isoform X2 n=1 Tax=Syzygium oleosum TaxID=219896 RepID=UPI0024B8D502|nr:pentatricopeptide repeat-containing protein At5g47360 isoform X2 [Syzygium oleosum]
MLRSSIARVISVSITSEFHKFSTLHSSATSPAEKFYSCVQQNGGNIEKALATVRAHLDSSCVSEVLTRRNPRVIRDVIESYGVEECLVSVKAVKVVLNLCKEAKLADEALWVLRKMPEFNLRADTAAYNIVIRLFCQKEDMDSAEKLMREMSEVGLYPDMITFVEMVKGFCNVGRLENAYQLIKLMRGHGCVPNVVVYSALLDGVCRNGNMDRTMELLTEMEKDGGACSPNVVTYTSVIQSLSNSGLTMEALGILDRMIAYGCTPNRVTVAALLEGLCKKGQLEEAYKLIDKVVSEGSVPNGDCYSSMVVSLMRYKFFDEAVMLFKRLLDFGLKPDSLASSLIIKELCTEGRVLDGLQFFDDIEKMGCLLSIDSDVYSVLLHRLCLHDHMIEAAKVMRMMFDKGVRLRTLYADDIVEHLKKCGDNELVSLLSERFR